MASFSFHTSTFSELGAPPDTSSSHGFVTNQGSQAAGHQAFFHHHLCASKSPKPRHRAHCDLKHCHDSYVVVCVAPKIPICTLILRDPLGTHLPKPFFFLPLSTFFRCCCDGNWSDDWSVTRSGMFFVAIFLLQVSEMAILFSIIETSATHHFEQRYHGCAARPAV